jgi:hypothetical protein
VLDQCTCPYLGDLTSTDPEGAKDGGRLPKFTRYAYRGRIEISVLAENLIRAGIVDEIG